MRRQATSLWSCGARLKPSLRPRNRLSEAIGRRYVRIYATPSSTDAANEELDLEVGGESVKPDARFEVLGAPFSLLSVQLSPSQNLYTRRGTLVALSGKAENAVSSLSILAPLTRAVLGIPFLYQKISSTSPVTALISTKSPLTSFATVHLDGRLDWIIAQRSALLAWSGHGLHITPRVNSSMSIAHWGTTHATGRGLMAVVGKGQIYQISLKAGEEYVVHPSNIVAYTMTQHLPSPYRFKASTLRFQIPSITSLFPDTRFFREMRKSALWQFLANTAFSLRTWTRRSIWGDRLFLHFKGPTTLLLQSRAAPLSDSLTTRDINEMADSPAGVAQDAVAPGAKKIDGSVKSSTLTVPTPTKNPTTLKHATVHSGKVDIK
ncbi:hypothetical protein Vi05172_g12616 [Venturia inaequalis]|nr:hypothetical protein Vi05172_g12616 [Venturia inaequalis]